jgi:hypothetical protein
LDDEKDPLRVALLLAAHCRNEKLSAAPLTPPEDAARFQQAFAFAHGAIQGSMRTGHPELSEIFEVPQMEPCPLLVLRRPFLDFE